MFHSEFRPRTPVCNTRDADPGIANDGVDAPELHMLAGSLMDEQIAKGLPPIGISDQMAALLSAAIRRRPSSGVKDPFGIYCDLLKASPFVLRDIYNHLLTNEDDPSRGDNPDLTQELGN